MSALPAANPTDAVPIDFAAFLEGRTRARAAHLINGVPDYSFSLDRKLRGRLSATPVLRELARLIVRSHEPMAQQMNLMHGIAVGPDQYPALFRIGARCAATLGIGVPRIFVLPDEAANAWTYASDDARPSIVITTRLLRGLDEHELSGIIGHECGHIHNLHSAYNTLVELLLNSAATGMLKAAGLIGAPLAVLSMAATVMGAGARLFLMEWSRAAEITSDRAGAICAGGVSPMMRALVKLKTGGDPTLAEINVDAYVRQLDHVRATPVKLMELLQTHPMTQKRLAALRVFEHGEVLHAWLPAGADHGALRSRVDVDRACEAIVRVGGDGAAD